LNGQHHEVKQIAAEDFARMTVDGEEAHRAEGMVSEIQNCAFSIGLRCPREVVNSLPVQVLAVALQIAWSPP
jgi:hypothetical protein